MNLTVLMENTPAREGLICQHGLSQYITFRGRRILFDAGPSEALLENAAALGVDLAGVDTCVLSHGHYDHANGLPAFFSVNDHAPVYLKPEAMGRQMSVGKTEAHYIGIVPQVAEQYAHRLRFVSQETDLGDGIVLLTHITRDPAYQQPQDRLQVEENGRCAPDPFLHELILTLHEEGGVHILTGCSHSGIVGMVETVMARFPEEKVLSVIGGFHLMQVPHQDRMNCTPEFAHALGDRLKELGDFPVYTAHCTGQLAFEHLQSRLGERISYLRCGSTLSL